MGSHRSNLGEGNLPTRLDSPYRAPGSWNLTWSVGYGLAAVAILAALHIWYGNSLWGPSEGVYAYSARALLKGKSLYHDFALAQPPSLIYAGAAVLAIKDSQEALRAALELVLLGGSVLVAIAVWRLTKSPLAATLGGLVSLLTPWSVLDHAVFMPETFAAPLLVAAALLASSRRTVAAAAVAMLATSFKLAFFLPAVALGLVARGRTRYLIGAAVVGLALSLTFLALYGSALVDNVIVAQLQTGTSLKGLPYLWSQAAWNLGPLLALAGLSYVYRREAHDQDLLKVMAVLLLSTAALLGTLVKHGSSLYVLVVAEPPAVILAVAGSTWALRAALRAPLMKAGVALSFALLAAQVGSLVVAPESPSVFEEPLRPRGFERDLSPHQVDRAIARARHCPTGVAYSGPAYIAFAAHRRMPGGEPDTFIISAAKVHAARLAAAQRDRPRCP